MLAKKHKLETAIFPNQTAIFRNQTAIFFNDFGCILTQLDGVGLPRDPQVCSQTYRTWGVRTESDVKRCALNFLEVNVFVARLGALSPHIRIVVCTCSNLSAPLCFSGSAAHPSV